MAADYELLDSGFEKKLERFGSYVLERPAPQALYRPRLPTWKSHARFTRTGGWEGKIPPAWTIHTQGLHVKISPTDFGHVGLFPEHAMHWELKAKKVLNLFAYSGGLSLALAKQGALVTHVDASKPMVAYARDNAALNGIDTIRWIVDDVQKFVQREIKRGQRYDAIALDPPSFGRGTQGQVFKLEEHVPQLLGDLSQLLAESPSWVLLTTHTPGLTEGVLGRLLTDAFGVGKTPGGPMLLGGELPSGYYARWEC